MKPHRGAQVTVEAEPKPEEPRESHFLHGWLSMASDTPE